MNATAPGVGASLQFATVRCAGMLIGVDIAAVQEVNISLHITSVPRAPAWIVGVANLRGSVVTVADLAAAMRLRAAPTSAARHAVIVRWRGEAIGLVVDEIGDILDLRESDMLPPPANIGPAEAHCIEGVYRLEHDVLSIIDLDRLLTRTADADGRDPPDEVPRPKPAAPRTSSPVASASN